MTQQRDVIRQAANVVTFVFTLVLNYLSNALPLNGRTAGQISDTLSTFFTPASYAFSIWAVIYLTYTAFTVYQALPSQRDNPRLRRIGYWPSAVNLINGLWLVVWHYGYNLLSVLLMLAMLASLLMIYTRLHIGLPTKDAEVKRPYDQWLITLTFSLYTAWICVATVANVSTTLVAYGWTGGDAGAIWSVVMIAVLTLVAVALLSQRANLPFAAVLVWALVAVMSNQPQPVTTAALVAAITIGSAAVYGRYQHRAWPLGS